jgi:heptosyltransferase-2
LCEALATHNAQIVVVGGPEERQLGERLAQMTTVPLITMIGRTSVLELACLIKRCRLFIAHDSSSLHLAAAMGASAIALFGPTDPRRHVPPTLRGQVLTHPVWCGPCYATRCKTVTHACMTGISLEQVLTAALTLLEDGEIASVNTMHPAEKVEGGP